MIRKIFLPLMIALFLSPSFAYGNATVVIGMAEDAYQGDAQYSLTVDGAVVTAVGTITTLNSSGQSQAISVNVTDGPHTIVVTFLNDAYGGSPSLDRNLYIKYITYNGSTLTGTSAMPVFLNVTGGNLTFTVPSGASTTENSADLSVVITQAGPPPPSGTPPQASAQGYTTLAFNADMTQSFDVACVSQGYQDATSPHQWYTGGYGVMGSTCANINYPHTDETDGSRVLNIHYGPSTQTGNVLGRVGISTSDYNGVHQTTFPFNAYYECVTRVDAYSISHAPLWHNCWMINAAFSRQASGGRLGMEFDLTEFHGGYPQSSMVGNLINWDCRYTCQQWTWYGDLTSKIAGYDPSQFHKYGLLIYQTSASWVHMRSYVDDTLIAEGDAQVNNDGVFDQATQRNYINVDLGAGCNWDEGGTYCMNVSINNVYADGSGNTHVQMPNPLYQTQNFMVGITGVTGVSSPINSSFHLDRDCGYGCNDIGLLSPTVWVNGNWQPIHFTGSYTGGGTVNAWDDSTHEMHVYVKSFKVWSCANWATTECSAFNPH